MANQEVFPASANGIGRQTSDHRPNDPCTLFTYDNLDRLTIAEYGIDDSNEVFTMDDLGNRDMVNVRGGCCKKFVPNKDERWEDTPLTAKPFPHPLGFSMKEH